MVLMEIVICLYVLVSADLSGVMVVTIHGEAAENEGRTPPDVPPVFLSDRKR